MAAPTPRSPTFRKKSAILFLSKLIDKVVGIFVSEHFNNLEEELGKVRVQIYYIIKIMCVALVF